MAHTCPDCKRSFPTELALELHRDTCAEGQLFCERCGERFAERTATRDGWYYQCPNEECDGAGLGGDLHRVEDVRIATQY